MTDQVTGLTRPKLRAASLLRTRLCVSVIRLNKAMIIDLMPQAATSESIFLGSWRQRPQLSGDIHLRYESNFGDQDARDRDRFVLRGIYAISDAFSVGAQLTTGDPDDPNSSDVTLSNFNDDLAISLGQIWLRAKFGTAQLTGGKVPLPFKRADMVWDGDVHPEGLPATFSSDIASAVFIHDRNGEDDGRVKCD